MTIEELKKLNALQDKIKILKDHLEKLKRGKAKYMHFYIQDYGNVEVRNELCNVDYLHKAYIHKIEAELALSEKIFNKWKLTR